MTGGICILSLLFQCLEMLFRELIHPVFAFLKHKDYYSQPDSSLQTESSRQGCIAPGFFIPADKISPPEMHRPEIFHLCRQNLSARDASPRDFSSLQTKSSRQGCIVPGFFIPADRISQPGMHRLRNYTPDFRAPPQSAVLTSIHLNACRAPPHLIKPTVPILKLPAFIPDDLLYCIIHFILNGCVESSRRCSIFIIINDRSIQVGDLLIKLSFARTNLTNAL